LVNTLKNKPSHHVSKIDLNKMANHYQALLNTYHLTPAPATADPWIENTLLDSPFELNELIEVLNTTKNNKAPGPDRIPYEFYKNSPELCLKFLLNIFNTIMEVRKVPQSFKQSIIFPIHKKGDINTPENYRGISFMDCSAKLFSGLILRRLTEWVNEFQILNEFQAGFRKHYSTIDNVFNLINIIKLRLISDKKVYAFFIDYKAAFDSINREALFYKLLKLGVSSKIVQVIRSLYENTESMVWGTDSVSNSFKTECGLKQGCLLSPLIYSLYVNDLNDHLESGIKVAGLNIKVLLYADDVVMVSDNRLMLQKMINQLETYNDTWNLTLNMEKSKIMVFRKGGGKLARNEKWTYQGKNIEIVNRYKYLGIVLSPNLSMKTHLSQKLTTARYGLNSVWKEIIGNNKVPVKSKFNIFNSVQRSVMCYGAQIWGYERHEEVEKLQRFFLKRMFGLPQNTPTYILYIETKQEPTFLFTLKLHINYINKILNLPGDRLPYLIGREIVRREVLWYKDWRNRAEGLGIQLCSPLLNCKEWFEKSRALISDLSIQTHQMYLSKALQATHHKLFKNLDHNINYIESNMEFKIIKLIMRARCGMLYLNKTPWREGKLGKCSLCNLNEDEDTIHFLAVCPILGEFRALHLGSFTLTTQQTIDYLNRGSFNSLYNYIIEATNYRKELTNEFNF
jgi:hypothetical protein